MVREYSVNYRLVSSVARRDFGSAHNHKFITSSPSTLHPTSNTHHGLASRQHLVSYDNLFVRGHQLTSSGTEQDRVNCAFYLKIGACRHGDRCSRKHIKPQFSQTILLANVYNNPAHSLEGNTISKEELQKDFDRFYEDFYIELCKYGHLLELHVSGEEDGGGDADSFQVCDNVGDHLMGNVYARYEWEAEASKTVDALNDRWYGLRPLHSELSPVSDFKEACCRQNEMGECKREG